MSSAHVQSLHAFDIHQPEQNQNPFSDWLLPTGARQSQPSICGALPYPTSDSKQSVFYFTSFNPTILNCQVLGPPSQLYYMISTDQTMPGYTVVKGTGRTRLALIEWKEHPLVEVRGTVTVPKQETRSWLRLSRDRRYRTMTIGETEYIWMPDQGHINLHSTGPSPQLLGRISRGENTVIVEVANVAVDLGLLDPIVTAAFLLQCGHSID